MDKTARKRRRERKKVKHWKWILPVVIAVILLTAAAIWYFGFAKPRILAENTMPQNGILVLNQQEDGTVLLTWDKGWNTDYYIVELLSVGEEPEPLFYAEVDNGESCVIPELPQDVELTLRVQSVKRYQTLGKEERIRLGSYALEAGGFFTVPTVENILWNMDLDQKQMDIQYDLSEGALLWVLLSKNDGQESWPQVWDTEDIQYTFGESGDYPVLAYGETYDFIFKPYFQKPGLTFYGLESPQISLERQDFLGTELNMVCQELGYNQYMLTWDETKGEHYEVQSQEGDTGEWVTLCQLPINGERTYTTPHMQRYTDYRLRVVAVGGQTLPDSEFAAISDEAMVTTGASLIFATVWPIQNLEVYSDSEKTEVIGTAPEASAYCVLAEENGLFQVRFEDGYGYIDGNYCMINLPEYIGSLCSYNITNSYSSLFMVHGYEIPSVSGRVVQGYEDIYQADGSFVVPLLYPTAQKLEQAAFAALEAGYRIKIYDSYRPQEASLSVYRYARAIFDEEIPEKTFQGSGPAKDLPTLPEPEEGEEPLVLTYGYLMTDNGRYTIRNFITDTDSQHNLGIAMDMTLVSLESGQDLTMQTAMHDLSWYSALARNNSNANLLSSIMKGAGFGGLFSEWWHFQDNDTRKELGLKNYMKVGVSPECWMADDDGWRYRDADGNYYAGCTATIGEREYSFDAEGYLMEATP